RGGGRPAARLSLTALRPTPRRRLPTPAGGVVVGRRAHTETRLQREAAMRTFVPACVLVVTCCSLPAAAAPQTCTPERIGGDQRGPATGLVRAGTRLVLATGGAVEIVD